MDNAAELRQIATRLNQIADSLGPVSEPAPEQPSDPTPPSPDKS